MHHHVIAGLLKVGRSERLAGPGQLDSSVDHNGEGCEQWPGHQAVWDQPPSRDATCPTGQELERSGHRRHLEVVGQLADLRGRVATVTTQRLVFRNGSFPSLAQRDTVLGDTCKVSATSAARR